jgi:hypothetical protein
MSIRTKTFRAEASRTTSARSERQSDGSRWSPSAVSFTETFASSPSAEIAASASWYAAAIDSADSGREISSPSTSTVARMPAALSSATTRRASSRVGPAMYGAETLRTTPRGTTGSTRATAWSNSLTGGDPIRA